MCDLEGGIVRTTLPDATIESIIKKFNGVAAGEQQDRDSSLYRGEFMVPLGTQLTPEQVATVPHFKVWSPNGRRIMISEKRFTGAEYRLAASVFGNPNGEWTVDGDVYVAIFFGGKYAYTSAGAYCQPSAQTGQSMTALQYRALEDFLTSFTQKVKEAEVLAGAT